MDDHERIYSAFLPIPVFCPLCRARRFTLDVPCQSCQRHEEARHTPSFPLERFRCSKCKSFRPITDYPLDQSNFRAATCSVCHARRRDEYCEGKGEPVSKEGRVRRFRRAQRVVEKALQGRIREEKLKGHWLKARERWERGELTEGWGATREQIESWRKGGEYCEGPYRQWVGYTDPRESSTGVGEGLREGSQGEESWEGLTDEEGSSTGLQDGWGGFPGENEARESSIGGSDAWEGSTGENEAREGPQEEREGSAGEGTGGMGLTGASGAWEHPRESRESSIAPPQGQYCSSCNRRKPLTDFGQFFTCNTCRERNKRANRARRTRVRKAVPPRPKATKQQLERAIQARASTSEYKLSFNKATRPITIEDYLSVSSS
ncbi:hypothetical protein F5882DRAFT_164682 [Hyaloscypha sp. PMI_1271]|nr:hypothetical protein F5882DRAFT_164682 [Hyaloscypha sp. PMI_1271]